MAKIKDFKERSTAFGKDLQALLQKYKLGLRPRAILVDGMRPKVELEIFDNSVVKDKK